MRRRPVRGIHPAVRPRRCDEDAEAAPGLGRLRDDLACRIPKRKADGEGADLRREFQKLSARVIELVAAAGNQQNLCAILGKTVRDSLADPASGAGDEDALILK